MFNKTTLTSMFNANKGTNFIITTSIGIGQGINGISFKTYCGIEYEKQDHTSTYTIHQKTDIVDFTDDCLVMMVENRNIRVGRIGTMKVYLPYSSIVMIEFVENTNAEKIFPKHLK